MTASNDDVISTLNDLLESCRDGEYGFTTSAEHTETADLKSLLTRHAAECRTAGQELVIPPKIKKEQAKGFSLFMLKAIMNGRGDEVMELARTNL